LAGLCESKSGCRVLLHISLVLISSLTVASVLSRVLKVLRDLTAWTSSDLLADTSSVDFSWQGPPSSLTNHRTPRLPKLCAMIGLTSDMTSAPSRVSLPPTASRLPPLATAHGLHRLMGARTATDQLTVTSPSARTRRSLRLNWHFLPPSAWESPIRVDNVRKCKAEALNKLL